VIGKGMLVGEGVDMGVYEEGLTAQELLLYDGSNTLMFYSLEWQSHFPWTT
jgi:hypothetical protein